MIDELRQIAIFAKTVEHGSFRAAAKDLRLSPSVVSHHVGQLEERLGTALLYRSTRKLSLTPDGERLVVAAQAMIEAAESGIQDISAQTRQLTGLLRITVPALFSQSSLMDELAKFSIENPSVELSIDFSDARRDLISDGYDVAIRAGDLKGSSLKAQLLFQFSRRLVSSPDYLAKHATPDSLDDLNDWEWLELAPVWDKKPGFRKAYQETPMSRKKSRISVNNAQALVQLVRAGTGLAIVPEYLAEPLVNTGELEYVLPDWTLDSINVYAVWPVNAPRNGLIKQLINFLKNNEGISV
jgi:DNA-binding transcriptional LysR family regulator